MYLTLLLVHSKGFCWYITLRTSGFLDFVHLLVFPVTGKPPNGCNKVDVPSSYLRMESDPVSEMLCSVECWIMDKVQKLSNPYYCEYLSTRSNKQVDRARKLYSRGIWFQLWPGSQVS